VTDKPINIIQEDIREESEHEAEEDDRGNSSFTASPPNELQPGGGLAGSRNLQMDTAGQNDSTTNLSGNWISSLAASPEDRSELKKIGDRDVEEQPPGIDTQAEKNQQNLPPFLASLSAMNASLSRVS